MEREITILKTGRGEQILISAEDFDTLGKYKWSINGCGYVLRRATAEEIIAGSTQYIYMHRQVMNFPENLLTDHINGIKTDNRRENLRLATYSQNLMNSRLGIRNTSGFKGIHVMKDGKFKAFIGIDGKQVHLGLFEKINDAIEAREKAELEYHGTFAFRTGV